MNHEQDRKIKELESLILPHKKDFARHDNQKANEADLTWNASSFFSKLVYQSEPRNDYWDLERVKKLKDEFEKKHSKVSGINELISKHWLREIAGQIKMASAVCSTCYDFEKVKEHRNELKFVQYLACKYDKKVPLKEESKKDRLSEKYYPSFLKNYEKENKLELDKDHITKSKWIDFKGNYVKPFSVDYYLIILQNWEDFAFLNYLKDKMNESRKEHLLIKKVILENIHEIHKSCFPEIPSLEEFESNETLRINGKFYQLKTYDEVQFISNYDGKIAAFIWSELAKDSVYKDDLERLNKFIELAQFREHLPSLHKYLSKNLRSRFLEASMQLILTQNDIKGVEQEIYKAFLDLGNGSNDMFASGQYIDLEPLSKSNNYYEFHKQLEKREDLYQNNLFFVQESRSILSFMIWEIMYLDTVYSKHEIIKQGKKELIFYQYANIKRLLTEGLEKPYLLWEVSNLLVQNRPDVIPFLLKEPQFASLAVCLLKKIEINSPIERVKVITQLEVLKEGALLSLTCSLIKTPLDKSNLALLLLHLFQEVTHNKFKINYNESIEDVELGIQQQKEKESLLLYELECFLFPINIIGSAEPKFLISFIFEELCAEVIKLEEVDYLKNGMLSFPLQKLDALCWLSKYCSQVKFISQIENIEHVQFHISTQFQKIYLETIEKEGIERKDFYSEKLINTMPNWSERNENLKKIEWIHPVCLLYKHGGLNQFLAPRFNFQIAKDEYDKANRFRADKLRSHVFVLLEILRQLNNSSIKIPYSKEELLEIKCSVERLLTDHLKKHSNSKGIYKIDILNHLFDRSVFRSHEEELLPQIVKVGNYFINKPSLFNLLLDKQNIMQLLIILDYVKVRWVETKCIHLLKATDVNHFLKKQYSIPEIEGVVNKLMLYDELKSQAAIAMSYWETKISPQKRTVESDFNIYEARLMKAYLKGDLDQIKAVEEPKRQHGVKSLFSASDHKMFFVGLYYFDQKNLKSVEIFERLRKKYPKNRTVALNLFAARITVGTKPLNEILLKEALSDWENYESTISINLLKFIEHQILINKLIVYNELKQYNQFEKLYKVIDDPIKFSEDFVKLKVSFLITLQRKPEAYELLEGAKQFHGIDESEEENYITELEKEVASTSNIKELRASLNEMKNSPIKTIAEVFQNSSNKGDVGRFFTQELAKTANKLLVKIKSIEEIRLEDKYNDLVESILESRLEQMGILVKEQPRGGLSATKKSLGERDFSFFNNGEEIAICEAFIGHAKSVVEPHIQKIFNYSHRRLNYYILMYDKNLSRTLTNRWNNYKEKTIPSIEYPNEFAIKKNLTVDLTNEFGYENSAIKIASTRHGENTTIYHILVNLNYEV